MAASPLYQQKLQEATAAYNKMKEQFDKTQKVENQLKSYELAISKYKESRPAGQEQSPYKDLDRQVNESRQKVLTLIPKDASAPSYFSEVEPIQKMVRGIRLILNRRQVLTNSIEFLEKEEQSLISEKGDLQDQLDADRRRVNEKEEGITKEIQEARSNYLQLFDEIQNDQKTYEEENKKLSEKISQNQNKSYELDFLTNQTQLQIDTLKKKINSEIKKLSEDKNSYLSSDKIELIKKMIASIESLEGRTNDYNDIIKSTKYLNVINNGAKILTNEANELTKEYQSRKEIAKSLLINDLANCEKDNQDTNEDLNDQEKQLNEIAAQAKDKEKAKQKLIEEYEKRENDRMELLVAKERADSSSLFAKSYREVFEQIKSEEEYIKAQKKDHKLYEKLRDTFVKDSKQIKDLVKKGGDALKDSQSILDNESKSNSELQAKLQKKHNKLSSEIKQKQNELEKIINRIQMRINPDGSQMNSLMNSGGSFCHGYQPLASFNTEHTTYDIDPDNGEISLNLATKDSLIDILFLKETNQTTTGYYPQLLLIWHNNRLPMNQFADMITERLQSQIDGKPVVPDVTNGDIFDNIYKLYNYWELFFKHDFYNQETRKSVINMLEALKNLTDDENNKDNAAFCIENITNKYETETEGADIVYDKIGTSPKSKLSIPLRLDPKSMAYHFMYIDLNNFQKIESYEFVKGAWGKPGKETNAKHINNLTVQFNKTAKMVLNTILTAADKNDKMLKAAEKRAEVIEAWIKIMDEAEKISDFNLIFEIDAAFTNPAISKKKLPYTYEKVNKELMARREQLSSLTAPNNKFKAYKARLEKAEVSKTLLYMGPWQTEMTFIDDGNKSSIPLNSGEDAINCKKQQAYFKQLSFLQKGWGSGVKFNLSKELLDDIINYDLPFKDDASLRQAAADTKEFDTWKEQHP